MTRKSVVQVPRVPPGACLGACDGPQTARCNPGFQHATKSISSPATRVASTHKLPPTCLSMAFRELNM